MKDSKRKAGQAVGVEMDINKPVMTRSRLKKQKSKTNSYKKKMNRNKKSKVRLKGPRKKKWPFWHGI